MGTAPAKKLARLVPASASEGRLNYTPYLKALIAHRHELNDSASIRSIARQANLNAKYFEILATTLVLGGDSGSTLLDELRQRIRAAGIEDADAIAEWIRAWQDQLWRFNAVGHLGIIRPWQEKSSSIGDRREFQAALKAPPESEFVTVSLTAATAGGTGPANVLWEKPRIVRPGKTPVMLQDVRAAAAAFDRHMDETFSQP